MSTSYPFCRSRTFRDCKAALPAPQTWSVDPSRGNLSALPTKVESPTCGPWVGLYYENESA